MKRSGNRVKQAIMEREFYGDFVGGLPVRDGAYAMLTGDELELIQVIVRDEVVGGRTVNREITYAVITKVEPVSEETFLEYTPEDLVIRGPIIGFGE